LGIVANHASRILQATVAFVAAPAAPAAPASTSTSSTSNSSVAAAESTAQPPVRLRQIRTDEIGLFEPREAIALREH
jgi:hypothetical protein